MRKAEDGQHVGGSQTSGAGKNIQESRETEQRSEMRPDFWESVESRLPLLKAQGRALGLPLYPQCLAHNRC